MTIRLRGHHLLCLLGYRGKGYSEDFCTNMSEVYNSLRTNPDMLVEIVRGPDDICKAFPDDQPNHCEHASIYGKDEAILTAIGIDGTGPIAWSDVCEQIAGRLEPEALSTLCRDCGWRSLGLCEEGIRIIQAGKQLPALS